MMCACCVFLQDLQVGGDAQDLQVGGDAVDTAADTADTSAIVVAANVTPAVFATRVTWASQVFACRDARGILGTLLCLGVRMLSLPFTATAGFYR